MPVDGKSPEEVMHTEMKKFKEGTLKSGSGHTVTDRDQALAIGLKESGQSKYQAEPPVEKIDLMSTCAKPTHSSTISTG